MNHISKYQATLERVSAFAQYLVGDAKTEFETKSQEFLQTLQDSQYIKVPFVGGFSAGKSSMLNVLTQCPGMLPVDTMPETAVAYELYYGTDQKVELYRNGQKIDQKPLSAIKDLATLPGDVAKVYCDSPVVRQLQDRGIILVDMPGIGSGIERHDAAIFHYIQSGTAFVLVVDSEQGTLRTTTLTFLRELSSYGMFPAVFLSKVEKQSEENLPALIEGVRYQLQQLGNTAPVVGAISSVEKRLGDIEQYLSSLNPEALVAQKLNLQLGQLIDSVASQLKIRVDLRSKDIASVEEKIKLIEEEISKVKAELPTSNSQADTPEKSAQDALDNVRAALEAKASDIAQMIANQEGEEAIKSAIVSIVRSEIIKSFKEESEQYSRDLGNAVQDSMRNLATIEVNSDILDDVSSIFTNFVTDSLMVRLTEHLSNLLVLGGPIGIVAKVVLTIMPSIIPNVIGFVKDFLFGPSDQEVFNKALAKVRNECIGQIVEGIRPSILKLTQDNQARIREAFQKEVVTRMENAKAALNEKMADANKDKATVQAEIDTLNTAIEQLASIKASL
ncbi:MAG: dynamin family protein [Bacteroidales bacterium]|nr:dynamin family protein [Bacteroidales bacterium]